jgi:hypothetical protein
MAAVLRPVPVFAASCCWHHSVPSKVDIAENNRIGRGAAAPMNLRSRPV